MYIKANKVDILEVCAWQLKMHIILFLKYFLNILKYRYFYVGVGALQNSEPNKLKNIFDIPCFF
jgi:hypothetical protein